MITFQVSDVGELGRTPIRSATLAEALKARAGSPVEAGASNLPHLIQGQSHALVQAVHIAFAAHVPLVLSPDDVWLCIAQGFGMHVSLHAEALRERFVSHEGKALIKVRRDDFVKGSPDNDWQGVFAEFSDRLAEHLGKKRDLVVADFSTTGPVERAASQVVLMSAMQKYFEYRMSTLCGIPEITLLGTVEDWRSVRRRAEVLAEFDLESWVKALLPVLDQFVAAAGGSVDESFWRSLYKQNNNSGGPYVTGWVNVLFPYIEVTSFLRSDSGPLTESRDTKPNPFALRWESAMKEPFHSGPTMSEIPVGLSSAPFVWEYLGSEIPMELLGGFVGVSQDPETLACRPAIGWAVREQSG